LQNTEADAEQKEEVYDEKTTGQSTTRKFFAPLVSGVAVFSQLAGKTVGLLQEQPLGSSIINCFINCFTILQSKRNFKKRETLV
jgi:hypothetical protein